MQIPVSKVIPGQEGTNRKVVLMASAPKAKTCELGRKLTAKTRVQETGLKQVVLIQTNEKNQILTLPSLLHPFLKRGRRFSG